jgi:hypothetical protein
MDGTRQAASRNNYFVKHRPILPDQLWTANGGLFLSHSRARQTAGGVAPLRGLQIILLISQVKAATFRHG